MDNNSVNILLNSQKNVASVNTDTYNKIELYNNVSNITEYDVRDVISENDVFDLEREANPVYRLYGKIEYISLLNGLVNNYKTIGDILTSTPTNSKNILNSFEFYLVRPASGYTKITPEAVSPDTPIFNETFQNWGGNTLIGWTYGGSVGSSISQGPNGIRFTLGNNPYLNLVSIYQDISPIYGNLTIKTNVSVLPSLDTYTDAMTIILYGANEVVLNSTGLISGGTTGEKVYNVSIDPTTPVLRIQIVVGSTSKELYMNYLQIYKLAADNPVIPTTAETYTRNFEVIATPTNFEIFPAGFSNNVYGEQGYAFSFNEDFDISAYFDNFGFPITEVYLYPRYKVSRNGFAPPYSPVDETLSYTDWGINGVPIKTNLTTFTLLKLGDIVYGDMIEYNLPEYTQTQVAEQTYYVTTTCKDTSNTTITLVWKYNPFIPFRLRYLSNDLDSVNTGSTVYDIVATIPPYATKIDDNGNYVWREIVPQGYFDPLTGEGVDYPFVNKRRYLFQNIVFSIVPDLNDITTATALNQIYFTNDAVIKNKKPVGVLDNIGKPCQA